MRKTFKNQKPYFQKSVPFKGHLWKKKPDLVEQYDKKLEKFYVKADTTCVGFPLVLYF